MREAGDVCFADSFKDGSGVVEFLRYEDMKYAIKKLDDSRFRSHEVSVQLLFFLLCFKECHCSFVFLLQFMFFFLCFCAKLYFIAVLFVELHFMTF